MPHATSPDGVELHYEVHDYTDPWKKGPPLILQHGYGRSSKFWYSLVPYIARFYRVICPDMRGLGQSSKDFDLAAGMGVEQFVGDILAVADAEDARDFHYAGESMGGIFGFALAALHPRRVRTLSLLSAPLRINAASQDHFRFGYPTREEAMRAMGSRGWAAAMNSGQRFPPGTDQAMMDWYADEMGKSDVEVLIAMAKFNATVDVSGLLPRIEAPVLSLSPSDGKTASGDQLRTLKEKVPHAVVISMPNPYHMIWVLAPEACAKHILHFMAGHDGRVCSE